MLLEYSVRVCLQFPCEECEVVERLAVLAAVAAVGDFNQVEDAASSLFRGASTPWSCSSRQMQFISHRGRVSHYDPEFARARRSLTVIGYVNTKNKDLTPVSSVVLLLSADAVHLTQGAGFAL